MFQEGLTNSKSLQDADPPPPLWGHELVAGDAQQRSDTALKLPGSSLALGQMRQTQGKRARC